jgi:hypothetical protein
MLPGEGEGFLQLLRGLVADLPGLVSDRVHLLALELRRAGMALGEIVVLGMAAALLGLTAWAGLWIGLVAGAIELGMPWGWAWALMLVLNLGAAYLAVRRLLGLLRFLRLPATMRRLTVPPPPSAPASLDRAAVAPVRPPMPASQAQPTPMP